ncbi:MAG: MoaD/ThiS family protein [Ginsengibacter sp.]
MKILAFGIVKEIFSSSMIDIVVNDSATIDELKILLEQEYPRLSQLGSYVIAVNNEYASPNDVLHKDDEIAVIPPVSGG